MMKRLAACLKKELLEVVRGKRIWIYLAAAVGCSLLGFFMLFIMNSFPETDGRGGVFKISQTLSMIVGMYNSLILQTYLMVVIFSLMGSVSKELKDKKWILPICSGMKPSDMILAKFIVQTALAVLGVLAGFIFTWTAGSIMYEVDMTFMELIKNCGATLLFTAFIAVLTVGLSALTKNRAISSVIPVLMIIFLPLIFNQMEIADYTPIFFYNYGGMANLEVTVAKVAVSSVVTVGISAGLIFSSAYISDRFMKIG